MFNTKKFKQAFIEAGKQTAKKKQELVKRYEELAKTQYVTKDAIPLTLDGIKELLKSHRDRY